MGTNTTITKSGVDDGSYLPSTATPFDKMKRVVTNVFIITIITLFVIDVAPTDMYPFIYLKQLQQDIDIIMDLTGLWQGQWTLFSPMPLRVNVRIQGVLLYRYHPYYDDGIGVETTDETNENSPKLPQTSPDYVIWKSPDWNYYENSEDTNNKHEDDEKGDEDSCNEDGEDGAADDANTNTNTDRNTNTDTNPYGNMTWLNRWRYFRLSEYIDNVRKDNSKELWESLVERLRHDHPRYITLPKSSKAIGEEENDNDNEEDDNDNDENNSSPIIVMYPYKVMLYRLWQYVNDPTLEELEMKNLFQPIQKQQLTWQSYNFYTWEDEHHGDNVLELLPKQKKKKQTKDDNLYAIPHDDIPLDKLIQWKDVPPIMKKTVEEEEKKVVVEEEEEANNN